MADSTINDAPVLTGELSMPRVGAWHAKIQSPGDEALSGSVTIVSHGLTFSGTVVRSGVDGGRVLTRVVGGTGKLPTELPAKNYANAVGVKVRQVVADLLREAGETLSADSEGAVLDRTLAKWERSKGTASDALRDILEPFGAAWRVLRDGTVWVGAVAYPEQEIAHVLLDEDWIGGSIEIAPEAPELRPAVTFLGQPISYVVHSLEPGALRTEARTVGSPGNLLERALGPVRREIDFSRAYLCKVTSQNADGTVALLPIDDRMKGRGLDKVRVRAGIPAEVKVPVGARCILEFAGGKPDDPMVTGWETTDLTELRIGGGELSVGRQGDIVTVFLDYMALNQIATALTAPTVGAFTVAVAPGPVVFVPMTPLTVPVPIQVSGSLVTGSAIAKTL
jgi:hypothetical protein